jgi:arylsulfatase A-like enzyme
MINALRLYWKILQPWLTVVVYLWTLQLIAVFGIRDPEPLIDRLADWSAILWTLLFWTALGVALIRSIGLLIAPRVLLALNDRGAEAAVILVTAAYFVRWLYGWGTVYENFNTVLYTLIVASLILGIWAWRRRRHRRQTGLVALSLRGDWHHVALFVLTVSVLALAAKMSKSVTELNQNRSLVSRGLSSHFSHGTSERRPNVVLVIADSLRAQSMSLFGYRRKTTPFIERFAERSTVFTQMYANSTSTRVSMTTILSGKHPLSHGRLTRILPPYHSPENLVALLRNQGYTTAAIASNLDASFSYLGLEKYLVYGQHANFSRLTLSWLRDRGVYPTLPGNRMYGELSQILPFLGFPEKTLLYGSANDALKRATQLVFDLPQPFFLVVHLHEPHSPYETPQPFRGKYAKLDHREVEQNISSDNAGRYPPALQPYVDAHRDHYDEAVEYLDAELEKFIQVLSADPKFRNSILIITADHGESFERGYFIHGEDLYESSVHVPLIIKYLNQDRGLKSTNPVQAIDLAPTILNAIGIPIPKWMDGRPATVEANLSARETVMINYKEPYKGHVYDRPTKLALRHGQYKLIASCDSKRLELYDLVNDPDEYANLAATSPALVKDLWGRLARYLAHQRSNHRLECVMNLPT